MTTYVSYECGVILFMISLCCGSALHPATETTEILDDNQRGGPTAVKEPSCPTWYLAVKHNAVSKWCTCGATLEGSVKCDDATLEALITEGACMSYVNATNDTVVGSCPFNYHHPDTRIFYTDSLMKCWGVYICVWYTIQNKKYLWKY